MGIDFNDRDLADRAYLRENFTLRQLYKMRERHQQSITELTAYLGAIHDVITECEKAKTGEHGPQAQA